MAFKRTFGFLIFGIQELKGALVYIRKRYNIVKFLFVKVGHSDTRCMPCLFIVDVIFLHKNCYINKGIHSIKDTIFDGSNTNANGEERGEMEITYLKAAHLKNPGVANKKAYTQYDLASLVLVL